MIFCFDGAICVLRVSASMFAVDHSVLQLLAQQKSLHNTQHTKNMMTIGVSESFRKDWKESSIILCNVFANVIRNCKEIVAPTYGCRKCWTPTILGESKFHSFMIMPYLLMQRQKTKSIIFFI